MTKTTHFSPENSLFRDNLAKGYQQRARLVRKFNVRKGVTEVEIDYWLLFIVDHYGLLPDRREQYVTGWDVVGKIKRAKECGDWPLKPIKNAHLLPLFRAAHGFPFG